MAVPSFFVEHRQHPRGERGSRISLAETARRSGVGRLDPEVRAWAIDQLRRSVPVGTRPGDYDMDNQARARAIYDGLRSTHLYVPDPVDAELIADAGCTTGSCAGIGLHGGDCDCLTVAYTAAVESVGVPAAVVGQSFDRGGGPVSHVLTAIWTGGAWMYVDASTPSIRFGEALVPTREIWLAVPSGEVLCDERPSCDTSRIQPDVVGAREHGDFVGMRWQGG